MFGVPYIPFSQAQMLEYGRWRGLKGAALDNFMKRNFGEPWRSLDKANNSLDGVVEHIQKIAGKLP